LGPSQKKGSIITASPTTFDLAPGVVIGSFMKKYGADANCAIQKVCSPDSTANVQPVEIWHDWVSLKHEWAKKAQFTHERVECNVFLFDEPLKGPKSLKIFKISLTFRFDKWW
jgi:hypothetical protein